MYWRRCDVCKTKPYDVEDTRICDTCHNCCCTCTDEEEE